VTLVAFYTPHDFGAALVSHSTICTTIHFHGDFGQIGQLSRDGIPPSVLFVPASRCELFLDVLNKTATTFRDIHHCWQVYSELIVPISLSSPIWLRFRDRSFFFSASVLDLGIFSRGARLLSTDAMPAALCRVFLDGRRWDWPADVLSAMTTKFVDSVYLLQVRIQLPDVCDPTLSVFRKFPRSFESIFCVESVEPFVR